VVWIFVNGKSGKGEEEEKKKGGEEKWKMERVGERKIGIKFT